MARALAGGSFTAVKAFGRTEADKTHFDISYYPLMDEAGRIIGAFHHARDITDRVRAEAGLAATQEALRQSQKMESLGQLTSGVAHDFNNLLTVMRSSADLLRRHELTDEKRRRYVDAISDTADRAARLTAQQLAFSRRQALKALMAKVFDAGACWWSRTMRRSANSPRSSWTTSATKRSSPPTPPARWNGWAPPATGSTSSSRTWLCPVWAGWSSAVACASFGRNCQWC